MKEIEALYYEKLSDREEKTIKCILCPHSCILEDGQKGICRVRYNRDGVLYTEIYGKFTALSLDPMEKKPLYHFYPGESILSVSSYGCNMRCPYCQNYHLSFETPDYKFLSKEDFLDVIRVNNIKFVAFTYNEPLIWFEYLVDVLPEIKRMGVKVVFVTNGMINEKPLDDILPYIDAFNVDIKSGSKDIYNYKLIGKKEAVERTIIKVFEYGVHLELTHLVVTEFHKQEYFQRIVDFIASISSDIPFHISKYFPYYKHKGIETPEIVLEDCYKRAREKLNYVYVGNTYGFDNNTYCPRCGALLVERSGYAVVNHLKEDRCYRCHEKVNFRI